MYSAPAHSVTSSIAPSIVGGVSVQVGLNRNGAMAVEVRSSVSVVPPMSAVTVTVSVSPPVAAGSMVTSTSKYSVAPLATSMVAGPSTVQALPV